MATNGSSIDARIAVSSAYVAVSVAWRFVFSGRQRTDVVVTCTARHLDCCAHLTILSGFRLPLRPVYAECVRLAHPLPSSARTDHGV